jgi:hypothetical protein
LIRIVVVSEKHGSAVIVIVDFRTDAAGLAQRAREMRVGGESPQRSNSQGTSRFIGTKSYSPTARCAASLIAFVASVGLKTRAYCQWPCWPSTLTAFVYISGDMIAI